MTDVKVEDGHCVLTPRDKTLAFEAPASIRDPRLLPQSLGDGCLFCFGLRRAATHLLHISV